MSGWWVGVVARRIILSAPVPVLFLWTLDFGFGTWIWDLDLGLDLGLTILLFYQLHDLIYQEKNVLNFDEEEYLIIRSSNCTSGGNSLVFKIKHPENQNIKGIEIVIEPYMTNEDLGLVSFNRRRTIRKEFNNHNLLFHEEILPEYSYKVFYEYIRKSVMNEFAFKTYNQN